MNLRKNEVRGISLVLDRCIRRRKLNLAKSFVNDTLQISPLKHVLCNLSPLDGVLCDLSMEEGVEKGAGDVG